MRSIACAVVGACLLSGCETGNAIGDPYFSRVKSTANVYARQSQSGVLKIAVMPFKASTELIGGSVPDMVVTEFLRTQKSYAQGVAIFKAESKIPAEELAEAIVLNPPTDLKVQVLEIRPGALSLRVVEPPRKEADE